MSHDFFRSTSDFPTPTIDSKQYRRLVGSLIFLCNTRPDISFTVGILNKFANKPQETHRHVGMRILKYIKGRIIFGITFGIHGYCDSDWTRDIDSRKSVSGYCFLFGKGAISWLSVKQSAVSLLSTNAESKSAYVAACEAVWLRRVLTDIGMTMKSATLRRCDTQSCIALMMNPVFRARTKHVEIQYRYIRELVEDGIVVLE